MNYSPSVARYILGPFYHLRRFVHNRRWKRVLDGCSWGRMVARMLDEGLIEEEP